MRVTAERNQLQSWIPWKRRVCWFALGRTTLAGSCIDQDMGEVDEVTLQRNLVDGCPCGQASIHILEEKTFKNVKN